jgi:thiol-disulfide isomerase/thioredoxin
MKRIASFASVALVALACLAWTGCNNGTDTDTPDDTTTTPDTTDTTTDTTDTTTDPGSAQTSGDPGAGSTAAVPEEWQSHTQGLPFVFGYDKGLAQAKEQNKPAMLFVTTTWCGWCKKLAGESFNDSETKQLLTENFVLVIVDGDTEKDAVTKLGVEGFPHVIFTSSAGDTLEEQRGYAPTKEFRAVAEKALKQAKA